MEKDPAESQQAAPHHEPENKPADAQIHSEPSTLAVGSENNNGLTSSDQLNGKPEKPAEQAAQELAPAAASADEVSQGDADKSTPQALVNSPNVKENSVNASTRVLLDESIYDRLASLNLTTATDDNPATPKTETNDSQEPETTPKPAASNDESQALDESAANRSKLLGEISDHSECSVEVDTLDQVEKEDTCSELNDEEMFIEEQEEDVEEEEEFHEVEEEKHKTSQESVPDSSDASNSSSGKKTTKTGERKSSAPSVQEPSEVKTEVVASASTIDAPEEATNSTEPADAPLDLTITAAVTTTATTQDSQETTVEAPTAPLDVSQLPTASTQEDTDTNVTKSDENTEPKEIPKATDWANIMFSTENPDTQPNDGAEKKEDSSDAKEEGEKKELDLDEDVKNPQYIPKKGVFYEHDDRSHDDNSKKVSCTPTTKDVEVNESKDVSTSKRIGGPQEKQLDNKRGNRRQRTDADRWNHDLFRDTRQKPKSKSELITAYGYDIRSERSPRNNQLPETRQPRASNSGSNGDRTGNQDNQRSRQIKDNRGSGRRAENQTSNRSRDRRSRRGPNVRNSSRVQNAPLPNSSSVLKNDQPIRSSNAEPKYNNPIDSKQTFATPPQPSVQPPMKLDNSTNLRDPRDSRDQRGSRYDGRTRRQSPRDRPPVNQTDDNLPPLTTVMPPITTWSNKIEDMVKEEANRRDSPSRHLSASSTNSRNRTTTNDQWPQNHQQNKPSYTDRGPKNYDENRQQSIYSNRSRYGGREEPHKTSQFASRNQFNERPSQQGQEWRRTTNYNNAYPKSTEYEPIKTQTFENSKLSQVSINRSHYRDQRDAREIINERRMLNQQQQEQNYQAKMQPSVSGRDLHLQHQHQVVQQQQQHLLQQQQHMPQRHQNQQQHSKHLQNQPHQMHLIQTPPHQHQQNSQHLRHQPRNHVPQAAAAQSAQIQGSRDVQHPPAQSMVQQQPSPHTPQQQQQPPPQLQHVTPGRQNMSSNHVVDNIHESTRLNVSATGGASGELMNNSSRPIVKTDSYTNAPQQSTLAQHPHNHLTGSMSQPSGTATTHIVPSHLGTSNAQAQYYSPTANSRDSAAAAAALASAYHGYMPGGHSVLDTSRYHMTSQLSDHGYIAPADPASDVPSAAPVLHQQGMYAEAAPAGSAVASSAYMGQTAANLSPSTNIPVTGAGPPPLTPVSYLQHSQYAPPPYTNPYSHPQHNHQAPPQSSHAYPYWTYI